MKFSSQISRNYQSSAQATQLQVYTLFLDTLICDRIDRLVSWLVGWLVAQRVIHCSSRWNFVPFWGRQQQEKHSKHPQKCHICLELFHLFKMEHVEQLNHYFGFDKHGDALKEAFSYPTHSTKWKNNHHEICFLYRAFSMRRVSPNIIIWPNYLIFHQPSKTLIFGFFGRFLGRLTLLQESEIVKHEILRLDILMNNVTSGHMLQCQQELLRQTGGQQTAKPRVHDEAMVGFEVVGWKNMCKWNMDVI